MAGWDSVSIQELLLGLAVLLFLSGGRGRRIREIEARSQVFVVSEP